MINIQKALAQEVALTQEERLKKGYRVQKKTKEDYYKELQEKQQQLQQQQQDIKEQPPTNNSSKSPKVPAACHEKDNKHLRSSSTVPNTPIVTKEVLQKAISLRNLQISTSNFGSASSTPDTSPPTTPTTPQSPPTPILSAPSTPSPITASNSSSFRKEVFVHPLSSVSSTTPTTSPITSSNSGSFKKEVWSPLISESSTTPTTPSTASPITSSNSGSFKKEVSIPLISVSSTTTNNNDGYSSNIKKERSVPLISISKIGFLRQSNNDVPKEKEDKDKDKNPKSPKSISKNNKKGAHRSKIANPFTSTLQEIMDSQKEEYPHLTVPMILVQLTEALIIKNGIIVFNVRECANIILQLARQKASSGIHLPTTCCIILKLSLGFQVQPQE